MRVLIIFFAIVLVAFQKTGTSIKQEENKGQVTMIVPATPWETVLPSEKAIKAGNTADPIVFLNRSTKRPSKKKWSPKRWIFRPPMEPI